MRAPWPWLASLAGAVALAGCGDDGGPGAASGDEALDGVALEATIEPGPDALVISYEIRNDGAEPVLVLNQVPVQDAPAGSRREISPDAVYVTRRGGGLVEVAKRTFDQPDGVDLYAPFLLDATVVDPGAVLGEDLTVPLPLEGRSLHSGADGGLDELPDRVERVVFCIGVIPTGGRDFGAGGEVISTNHGLDGQRLLCSDEVALPEG